MTTHEAAKFAAMQAVADYFDGRVANIRGAVYMAVTGALSRVCPAPKHTMRVVHHRLMTDFSHGKLDSEERGRLQEIIGLLEQAMEGDER